VGEETFPFVYLYPTYTGNIYCNYIIINKWWLL